MADVKPILIIAGPTAVGKTDASILLAKEFGAEIVSADSLQIYRGMDIGSAKPTLEQRRMVYHHMIDIVEPDHPYSVGDYLRDARSAIDGILATGGTPIVVGGTGLYIRALMRGLFHGPPASLDLREQLMQREADGEPGILYADLVKVDPEAAIKIHPNDLRRTVRALEVFYLRDKKLSDFQREHAFKDSPHAYRLLFLVRSRRELYPRIEARVELMLKAGLEAEVKLLKDRGYSPDLAALRGLGYKHFLEYFQGVVSRDEAIQSLKRDTKRFAKRQFTWFRRESDAVWVDVTGLVHAQDIADRIKKTIEISNELV